MYSVCGRDVCASTCLHIGALVHESPRLILEIILDLSSSLFIEAGLSIKCRVYQCDRAGEPACSVEPVSSLQGWNYRLAVTHTCYSHGFGESETDF